MATTTLDSTNNLSAEEAAGPAAMLPKSGFAVELFGGQPVHFESTEALRAEILSGTVAKTALIRVLGGPPSGKPVTVEAWARSNPKLRSLYAPVWSLTLRGAFVGLIVVGILKTLDTLIALASANPAAGFLWLLLGAGMFSPKWKLQIMAAAFYFGFQAGANLTMLWGAWMGVGAFAAVFGVSAGMVIGTVVGLVRASSTRTAPDACKEGRRPVVFGILAPLAVFAIAAVTYLQVLMPVAFKLMER